MSTKKQASGLQALAQGIHEGLQMIYGQDMGFILCVAPFVKTEGEDKNTDYISNSDPDSAIKWLRDSADRLENRETMPPGSEGDQ